MAIIGFSMSNFFMTRNVEDCIRFAIEKGFQGMELWGDVPFCNADIFNEKERRVLRDKCKENNIYTTVHAPIFSVNINGVNPGIRNESLRQLKRTVDMASETESKIVVVHSGQKPSSLKEVKEYTFQLLKDALFELIDYSKERGVVVALENNGVEDCWEESLEDFLRIIKDVDVKCTLDVGHAHCTWGIEDTIRAIGDRVVHIHISDNDGFSDRHDPVGKGKIDFQKIVPYLKEFKGMICHEIQDFKRAEEATLESVFELNRILDGK